MIRLYILISISLLAFLSSCEPPIEEPPADLISEAKFKAIAIKLHLLESYIEKNYKNEDTAKVAYNLLESKIFKKEETKPEFYKLSYEYYLRNTDLMDNIYEQIVDSLGKMETQTKVKEEIKEEK